MNAAADDFLGIVRAMELDPNEWSVGLTPVANPLWCVVRRGALALPERGWKLHLSGTVFSAQAVLRTALPVIVEARCSFKVAASLSVLARLNAGAAGLSQIGKLITVYPEEEGTAVVLAQTLDEVTRGLAGPRVTSDLALRPGGIVFYRFGDFASSRNSVDDRLPWYVPPRDRPDPFAGKDRAAQSASTIGAGRYLILARQAQSPRGDVSFAADLHALRGCIVKRAELHAAVDERGRDARARLLEEIAILRAVAPLGGAPRVLDVVETPTERAAILEDLEGEPLSDVIRARFARGETTTDAGVLECAELLAGALGPLHAAGWAHGDIKAANVILGHDLRLVDFELAHPISARAQRTRGGTRGSLWPAAGDDPGDAIRADIYALGATLYHFATGADPALAPDGHDLATRSLSRMSPGLSRGVTELVERCLRPAAVDGLGSTEAVLGAIARLRKLPIESGEVAPFRADWPALASWLGVVLADHVERGVAAVERDWTFATGLAGTTTALAALAACCGTGHAPLGAAARALAVSEPSELLGSGLYRGEGGVALALVRAAAVLRDQELLACAARICERLAAATDFGSVDLAAGLAGNLMAQIAVYRETGDCRALRNAIVAGEAIMGRARRTGPGSITWDGLHGYASLGHAQGVAGVCEALLELHAVAPRADLIEAVSAGFCELEHRAVPSPGTRSLVWFSPTAIPLGHGWADGGGGIVQAFARATRLFGSQLPRAKDLALAGAQAIAACGRGADASMRDGLAGSVSVLLDVAEATGDERWTSEALEQGELLSAFVTAAVGRPRDDWFPSPNAVERGGWFDGIEGVAACVARLSGVAMTRAACTGGARSAAVALPSLRRREAHTR